MPSNETLKLLAPVSGPVLPLENVPDPVFAQKAVGPGLAVDPTTEVLLAPIAGRVVMLHRAHHAITLEQDGRQVLLHIGLDTVKLGGEGFTPLVKQGDVVRAGQELIRFDADLVAARAKSLITIMVVTDTPESALRFTGVEMARAGQDVLVEVGAVAAATTDGGGARARSAGIAIDLPTGLHARPAALLVGIAKKFGANVQILRNGKAANAKSVVGIMGLEIANGDRVHFEAEGADAEAAVAELAQFLAGLEEAAEPVKAAPKAAPRRPSGTNLLTGVGVSPGVAIGRVHQVRTETFKLEERAHGSAEAEKEALDRALRDAKADLAKLAAQVKLKTDASRAAIFAAHQELLEDPDIVADADQLIAKGRAAAFAWNRAIDDHANRLASLNNEMMANRANDLRDVGRRVLRLLTGSTAPETAEVPENAILIAENLTPSETVQLDRSRVLGFCTTTGGATSHVAILARSLGLPAIAGVDPRALTLEAGTEVILDGDLGDLRLQPGAEEKQRALAKQNEQAERRQAALTLAHKPAATRDGRRIEVAANIGSVADARQAVEMGADGVGLLRSEFLFLERDTPPSEDEQYRVYQDIADVLGARPLVIRTLDVGGDKPLKYLPIEAEENPFLGVRGIRVGFLHPEILRQQLRAILRVKTSGKLCVMFPMIAAIEEFRMAKKMLEEERAKLRAPPVEVGIMVEVPSVALTADVFAREVDFFSVGTNDLTQYTLAMDRGHTGLAKQVDALHPSVLKMIQLSCDAAKAQGKWVGVCGGLASDLKAVPILIGLGVTELSVSIPTVPLVKSGVREVSTGETRDLASRAVVCDTPQAVRELKIKGQPHEQRVLVPAEDR